ncbi:MAG: energy transducer TonB [Prolixibacteraceae bacterium]
MKRLILFLLLNSIFQLASFAQTTDTIYVDENFKITSKYAYAYYRILQQYSNNNQLYLQTDYYKTGEVKQIGTYILKSNKVLTGKNYNKLKNQNKLTPDSIWTMYYEPGMLGTVNEYKAGKLILSYWMDYNLNDKIYITTDKMPIFPGGPNALKAHISRAIQYPMNTAAMKESGRAYVSFWINKKGEVENVHLARSCGSRILDLEALRVVSTIPNFLPGIVDGMPVIVSYTIPITFSLQ